MIIRDEESSAEVSMLSRLHKAELPPDINEVFEPLRNEISFLHGYWEVYQQVFADPAIGKVMELTPGGFRLIKLTMHNEIVMGLSRVTDPKATGKKENLTLQQLLHVVEKHCTDGVLLDQLKQDEEELRKECEPFRAIRNRSLAHLDLPTFLGSHPDPLPAMDVERVKDCLERLARFMNDVLGHLTTKMFDFVPHLGPRPQNIVYGLRKFLEWQPIIDEIERKKVLGK